MLIKSIIVLHLLWLCLADSYVYYSPCNEDGARDCPSSTNRS